MVVNGRNRFKVLQSLSSWLPTQSRPLIVAVSWDCVNCRNESFWWEYSHWPGLICFLWWLHIAFHLETQKSKHLAPEPDFLGSKLVVPLIYHVTFDKSLNISSQSPQVYNRGSTSNADTNAQIRIKQDNKSTVLKMVPRIQEFSVSHSYYYNYLMPCNWLGNKYE